MIDFYTLQRPLRLEPAGSIAVARIAAVGATSPLVAASGNYRCPPALAAYGLRFPRIADDATRRAVIRAYNVVSADYFGGLGDRLTPAAIIPMHTPDEAIHG